MFCALLQSHVRTNYVDHTEVEHVTAELEAKLRFELNRKLEEVNSYLEKQARRGLINSGTLMSLR